jgi:hypothetical protein
VRQEQLTTQNRYLRARKNRLIDEFNKKWEDLLIEGRIKVPDNNC